jgi:uncharacterized protein YjbI with pentapeptide repeats
LAATSKGKTYRALYNWEAGVDLDDSLALYARGRQAWNAWGETMLHRRRALLAAGGWGWALDSRCDPYPTNKATGQWWHDAAAQFSYREFAEPVDFTGFVFPGAALFVGAKFRRRVDCRGARFYDGACFNFARLDASAIFDAAEFCSHGSFDHAQLLADVSFAHCRFVAGEFEPSEGGRCDCSGTKFARPVSFTEVRCGYANFSDCEFSQAVSFAGAAFSELFFISGATFGGEVRVRGAQFPYEIDWSDATLTVPPTC